MILGARLRLPRPVWDGTGVERPWYAAKKGRNGDALGRRMTNRIFRMRYGGLDDDAVREICTKLLAVVEGFPDSHDLEQRREAAQLPLQAAETLAQADPHAPLSDALNTLAAAIQSYVIVGAPVILAAQNLRKALDETMREPVQDTASATESISHPGYGGMDNAAVYEVCTKLLAVVAALPNTDNFEERRAAAHDTVQIALNLARADPHTPLSDALYALAAAVDLYIHFRQKVGHEADAVRDALDQTLR